MRAGWVALAASVVLFMGPGAARGQVLVTSERNLDFGQLTPGAVTTVAATDMIRSGQLRIAGRGTFQVTFQLPTSLVSPAGHQIPVVFGPADGLLTIRHRVTTFDPTGLLSFRLNPADREGQLNLGASAQPAPGQAAGSYSAVIVVMVVQTGT
jgi:hypothetical protein